MKKTMIALTVVALAVVGADASLAQDPCQPSCDVETNAGAPATGAAVSPVLLAMTALLVIPRARDRRRRT
jgi:hypothetical protein